jgi:DnaJ family protein A protein 5
VLSNPQERAWYDSHRDQILKGRNVEESKEEDSDQVTKSKLNPYFNSSCFSGFSSGNVKGFYRVFGDLFKKMDDEEEMEE